MQNLIKVTVPILVTVVTIFSCTFEEKIVFDKDGSGTFSTGFRVDSQQLKDILPSGGSEAKEGFQEDTIMYFKDMIDEKLQSGKDFDAEELKRMELLRPCRMILKMDSEKSIDIFMEGNFQSIQELGSMMNNSISILESRNNKQLKFSPFYKIGENPLSKVPVAYSYSHNVFERQLDLSKINEEVCANWDEFVQDLEGRDHNSDDLSMENYFAEMSYTMVFEFPKPIKSVNDPKAEWSADRKTVSITTSFLDYVKNAPHYNLRIELE